MSSYCLKCKKNTDSMNPKMTENKNGRTMLLSRSAVCGSKKSRFMKKQEAKGILSSLAFKTPLSRIPFYGDVLF